MRGLLTRVAEGVVEHLRQPLAKGSQTRGGALAQQGGVGGVAGRCRDLGHGLIRVGPFSMGGVSGIGNR